MPDTDTQIRVVAQWTGLWTPIKCDGFSFETVRRGQVNCGKFSLHEPHIHPPLEIDLLSDAGFGQLVEALWKRQLVVKLQHTIHGEAHVTIISLKDEAIRSWATNSNLKLAVLEAAYKLATRSTK